MTLKFFLEFLQSCEGSKVHNIYVPIHLPYDCPGGVHRCLDEEELSSFLSDRIDKIEFYHCSDSDHLLIDIYLYEYDYSFELKKIE